MNNLTEIKDMESFEKATKGHSIVIFSANWCPDCQFLKTYLDDLIADNSDWTFYSVDRDELTDLCIGLDILGIPSFIAYKDGKEVSRFVSKLRKTQEEVQAFIDAIE